MARRPVGKPAKLKAGKLKAFRFLDLPAEIRIRVYELLLQVTRTIDLGAYNHHKVAPLLNLFLACHQLHEEAYRVFYGSNAFRLFSTDGKFYHTKHPLLSRFSPSYRAAVTTIELKLGPGWNSPPENWVIAPKLGLHNCMALKTLKVFVELDPESISICQEWLKGRSSYTEFSTSLLVGILEAVPSICEVRFDGFPSVQKDGPLMTALVAHVKRAEKRITYGPLRGWSESGSIIESVAEEESVLLNNRLSPLWASIHSF